MIMGAKQFETSVELVLHISR